MAGAVEQVHLVVAGLTAGRLDRLHRVEGRHLALEGGDCAVHLDRGDPPALRAELGDLDASTQPRSVR